MTRYKRSNPYVARHLDTEATYEEVAAEMGITVARVGRIEHTALERLRKCWRLIESGMRVDDAVEICKGRVGRPRKAAL